MKLDQYCTIEELKKDRYKSNLSNITIVTSIITVLLFNSYAL